MASRWLPGGVQIKGQACEFVHVKIGEVTDDVDAGQLPAGRRRAVRCRRPPQRRPRRHRVHRDTGEMAARDEAVADEPDAQRTAPPSCRCRRTRRRAHAREVGFGQRFTGRAVDVVVWHPHAALQIESGHDVPDGTAERRRSEVLGVDPCHTMASWKPP